MTLQDQVKFAEQQALEATGMSEDLRAKLFELELGEPTKDNIDDPISRQSSANLSVCGALEMKQPQFAPNVNNTCSDLTVL